MRAPCIARCNAFSLFFLLYVGTWLPLHECLVMAMVPCAFASCGTGWCSRGVFLVLYAIAEWVDASFVLA